MLEQLPAFICSFVAVFFSLGVVFLNNPLYCALSLIGSFLGVAGIFAVLGAHFLAVTQIVVYAGAIVVLIMFVIMLLNIKVEQRKYFSEKLVLILASVLTGFALVALFPILKSILADSSLSSRIGKRLIDMGDISALAQILFKDYLLAFELCSILLIAAMVGAVLVARSRDA